MAMSKEMMIIGHQAKEGRIKISGSKNSALALMAACLLSKEDVRLKNVPKIGDVEKMKHQLRSYGVRVSGEGTDASPMVLNASQAHGIPEESGTNPSIRAAIYALGPSLARFREAQVFQPGGCNIQNGGRPIGFHTDALVAMGARLLKTPDKSIKMVARNGLRGANIEFPKVSVGATVNTIMAASLAEGTTTISNASVEPEVIDLVDMLNKMGANVTVYKGDRMIVVEGTSGEPLSDTTHTVIPDRIEAGTYAIAAAIVGGSLLLEMDPAPRKKAILIPVEEKLKEAGIGVKWTPQGLEVWKPERGPIKAVDIVTGPYPEFPTDLLPQWVTLMTQARGKSRIEDTIYDNRFGHVPALQKMGANITKVSDTVYEVTGGTQLQGQHVTAKDLRGGMALVLAALIAIGTTVVKEIQHVHRGYANLVEKLKECGALFHRVFQPERPQPRQGHYGGHRG